MLRNLVFSLSFAFLAACASTSGRYDPPPIDASPSFGVADPALVPEPPQENAWWTRFEDPSLTHLVEAALRANLDVREAAARVEAARTIHSEARQASLPTGAVTAGNTHQSVARHRTATASAGIEIGWEIDLFGRVRNLRRGAEADLGATEALLAQTRVVVAAEVVRTWFLLRGAEERVALLDRYRADQAEVVGIVQARVEEGVDDGADLARARTVLAEDMLALARERHRVRLLRHALAVLIGATPGQWEPPAMQDGPLTLRPIAIGNPTALLQRRPDVRAAERALAAQTADIGVAAANLFPQLSLGGVFGFLTGSFGDLGAASGESWAIGPTVTWGIFDLGRLRAQVRRERAEAEGALAAYERTVLRALEETENSLSAFAAAQESLAASDRQLRNARIAADLVHARYEEGAVSYFEFLDARRAALRAGIARIDSIAAHRTATVDVFRALGIEPAAGSDVPADAP